MGGRFHLEEKILNSWGAFLIFCLLKSAASSGVCLWGILHAERTTSLLLNKGLGAV